MNLSHALGVCALLASGCPGGAAAATEAQPPQAMTRAVWIWGRTVRQDGAEKVAGRLSEARIDTALLLVKGIAGRASFRSASALGRQAEDDVLREMLDACRPRGIRVHAWLMFHGDQEWVKAKPEEAMHSCGGQDGGAGPPKPSTEKVCPAAPGYRQHLKALMRDILAGYAVDGIHLDGIRYPTLASCFCPRHRERAAARGIDFEKVRRAAVRSTHEPEAKGHFIDLYRQGDADVRRWVEMRREEIDTFVSETQQLVREVRPGAQLSAALMPEGAEEDDAFALCHYAQDYRTVGAACDFICPMSYHVSYGKPTTWPAEITARAAARSGRPALAGLQAFDASTPADLGEALREVESRHLPGFALFRYGTVTPGMWDRVRE